MYKHKQIALIKIQVYIKDYNCNSILIVCTCIWISAHKIAQSSQSTDWFAESWTSFYLSKSSST